MQRVKDVESKTEPLRNGHEAYSIVVAFVGGINTPTTSRTKSTAITSSSYTEQQFVTFNVFLRLLYEAYPGVQVMGYNDIDRSQTSPGFDVVAYTQSKFGKTIVYTDPSNQKPFSAASLRTINAVYNEEL